MLMNMRGVLAAALLSGAALAVIAASGQATGAASSEIRPHATAILHWYPASVGRHQDDVLIVSWRFNTSGVLVAGTEARVTPFWASEIPPGG
jgi:hypothetical protein